MVREVLIGMACFFGYYGVMASILLVARRLLGLSGELFRKMLHLVCVMSVFVLLYAFETWYIAVFVVLVFTFIVYVVLRLLERYLQFMQLLEQRRSGEIRSSLLIVFFMMATLIAFAWGWLGADSRYLVVVSNMAWGFGDAAAAVVGKSRGKRHIRSRFVEGTKTLEGTAAMFLVSAIVFSRHLWCIRPFPGTCAWRSRQL